MKNAYRLLLFLPILICLPLLTVFAAPAEDEFEDISVSEFYLYLLESNLLFFDYIDLADSFEEDGIYAHHLNEYEPGYQWFLFNNPSLSQSAAIAFVNVGLDFGPYTRVKEIENLDAIEVLVNKNHILPQDYTPHDLIRVAGTGYQLRSEAAEQFTLMREEMKENKLNIYIISAYRSFRTQRNLYRNAFINDGISEAEVSVAREGHSEHQTGLAVDILHRSYGGNLSSAKFEDTDEYMWLIGNAHKYGFILRYPEEYTGIHGYMYEPWHWRYVGADIATAMYDKDIKIYEEFYGKYLLSDVLQNVSRLVTEKQERLAAEEEARLAQIAADELAAQEAALAAEIAAREAEAAEQERIAAEQAEAQRIKDEQQALLNAVDETDINNARYYIMAASILGLLLITVVFIYTPSRNFAKNKVHILLKKLNINKY